MTVIADTGALYALIDASDAWHSRVLDWWTSQASGVVVPVSVLPEICYLLQTRIGTAAESAFVRAVADDEFTIEPLEPEDFPRASALIDRYEHLPLGFVDASVVAIAERLGTREILTTDRRHFSAVRARHTRSLTLLP